MAIGSNEQIEFDVLINGKMAKKTLKELEAEQEKFGKTTEKTSKSIKLNWKAIGAGIAAAGVTISIGAMIKSAISLERAMFGLTDQTKKWIAQASIQYGQSQEMIAGWVQTAKASGLASEEIEKMIDMSVALGRAFPLEATETMVNDLTEFYDTGKEAGIVTRILEGALGEAELETASFGEKMKILEERTAGVNKEFDKTTGAKIDKSMQQINKEVSGLSDSFFDLAQQAGVFAAIDWGKNQAAKAIHFISKEVKALQSIMADGDYYFTKLTGGDDLLKKFITKVKVAKELKKLQDTDFTLDPIIIDEGGGDGGRPPEKPDTTEADKERAIALAANERFWDDYNHATMEAMDYEVSLLDKQYKEYDKYVKDKVALEEWYNAEKLRLLEEFDTQMTAYRDMADAMTQGLTDGILAFTESGKLNFKDMANSIIQDMLRIQIQSSMMSLFGSFSSTGGGMFGGLFDTVMNAKGNAFSNGRVTPFADGGVVSSPTAFPMSGGMGIMGEEGPEVIAPLKRDSSGNMGVGAVAPNVNVNVQNFGNDNVQVEQSGDNINIIISQIASSISRGTGDVGKAIEGRYGISKK